MTQPPYSPAPVAGFPPEPVPSIWMPVILGTLISSLLTFFPPCAVVTCMCCGVGLWPGLVAALMLHARRDRGMRVQDGAVIGFVIGGLTGLLRAASDLARGGIVVTPEEKKEFFEELERLSKTPLEPAQRQALEDSVEFWAPYLPWATAVVFAVCGVVVGAIITAMITSSRRRQWVPPPPPPGVLPAR